jgi:HAMP domain-containing protein
MIAAMLAFVDVFLAMLPFRVAVAINRLAAWRHRR